MFKHIFEKRPLTIDTKYQTNKLINTNNNQWTPGGTIDFEPMEYEEKIRLDAMEHWENEKAYYEELMAREEKYKAIALEDVIKNPKLKEIMERHGKIPKKPTEPGGTEPTEQPGTESTVQPGTEPTVQPGTESTVQPGTEPTVQPGTESTMQPGTEKQSIFGNYKPSNEMQNVYNAIDQLNIDETLKNQLKIQYMREDIIRREQREFDINAYSIATKDAWRAGINPNLINLQPASSSASTSNAQGINASMYATQSNEVIQKAAQEIAYYQAQINAGKLSVEQAKQELEEQKFIANTNRQITQDEREWTLAWVNIVLNMIDTFV